jgi:hypothetical protein
MAILSKAEQAIISLLFSTKSQPFITLINPMKSVLFREGTLPSNVTFFVPDRSFNGTHWDAAALCYSQGQAGLAEINTATSLALFKKDVLPLKNETFFLASTRL